MPVTYYGDLADSHAYVAPSVNGQAYVTRPDHFHHHKRSAEPHGVAPVALHPGLGHSYVGRTVFGYPHGHLGHLYHHHG